MSAFSLPRGEWRRRRAARKAERDQEEQARYVRALSEWNLIARERHMQMLRDEERRAAITRRRAVALGAFLCCAFVVGVLVLVGIGLMRWFAS